MLPTLLGEHANGLSLHVGNWKLIEARSGQARIQETKVELGHAPQPQLYNLSTDRGETKNLVSEQPEKVAEMRAILSAERTRAGDASESENGKKKGK